MIVWLVGSLLVCLFVYLVIRSGQGPDHFVWLVVCLFRWRLSREMSTPFLVAKMAGAPCLRLRKRPTGYSGWTKSCTTFLGVDSVSSLFNHCSFQKPAVSRKTGFFDGFLKSRILERMGKVLLEFTGELSETRVS